MGKIIDFLHSRTFITHVTGLAGILGAGYAIPNSTPVSIAVAALTGLTQAAHAYQAVRTQPQVTPQQITSVLGQ